MGLNISGNHKIFQKIRPKLRSPLGYDPTQLGLRPLKIGVPSGPHNTFIRPCEKLQKFFNISLIKDFIVSDQLVAR